MKKFAIIAATLFSLASLPAHAENAQQQKMITCNADAKAKNLSGDARKSFMKDCLSAGAPEEKKLNAQQQKMKDCNAEAKGMKGEERKKHMSGCLKGSG